MFLNVSYCYTIISFINLTVQTVLGLLRKCWKVVGLLFGVCLLSVERCGGVGRLFSLIIFPLVRYPKWCVGVGFLFSGAKLQLFSMLSKYPGLKMSIWMIIVEISHPEGGVNLDNDENKERDEPCRARQVVSHEPCGSGNHGYGGDQQDKCADLLLGL